MKDGPWWQLDAGRINFLQQDSVVELVKRCKGAHFVNVHVRINGKWEIYEADWIKHLQPRERPMLAWWRERVWRLRCRWNWWRDAQRGSQSNEAQQANIPAPPKAGGDHD